MTALLTTWLALNLAHADGAKPGNDDMDTSKYLQDTAWWVEDIAGKGVIDMSHTTVEFSEPGRISGDTGCNRYFGSVTIKNSGIEVGPLAGTRKACAPALMDQEMKFYRAMSEVRTWELADTGLLHLRGSDGTDLIRASRIEKQPNPSP